MRNNEMKNIYNLISKMNEQEFNLFVDIIKNKIELSEEEVELLSRRYALRDFDLFNLNENIDKDSDWTTQLYVNEIKKINMIINNDHLLNEIGGLKILLFGKTGTGKTTLVENIIKFNNGIKFENVKWHNLVSPKLGQTQINIMQLENELSNKKNKIIVFLDELDSLITNRNDDKDIAEYSRIVGTFIKFMDMLKPNIIFIASTNVIEKIDSAITRRFNVKIQGKTINFIKFYEFIDNELDLGLTTNEKNLLQNVFREQMFTISDARQFISNYMIESNISSIKNNWAYILISMNGLSKIDLNEFSKTKQEEIEKVIKKYGEF